MKNNIYYYVMGKKGGKVISEMVTLTIEELNNTESHRELVAVLLYIAKIKKENLIAIYTSNERPDNDYPYAAHLMRIE